MAVSAIASTPHQQFAADFCSLWWYFSCHQVMSACNGDKLTKTVTTEYRTTVVTCHSGMVLENDSVPFCFRNGRDG
ncbi:hypothetical protein WB926_005099 [Salmonella enterica]|nr:hypothetical protein [Salmonella enterica]